MKNHRLSACALVSLLAGLAGCAGNSQPVPGSAQAQAYYAQQAANQGQRPIASSAFGQAKQAVAAPWGAVQDAYKSMTHKAPNQQPYPVIPEAPQISLNNKAKPSSASLFVSMGKLAEQNGNTPKARELYQKALAIAPTDVNALLAYGHLEDRQGKLKDALKLYDQAVRANPKNAAAHNDLGLCLARKGDSSAALVSLAAAIKLNPQKKLYRNNMATVLMEENRPEEALSQLAAVYPPAISHYNMGILLNKKGNRTEAIEHFATAARLDSNLQAANDWLAKLGGSQNAAVVARRDIAPQNAKATIGAITPLPANGVTPANADLPQRVARYSLQTPQLVTSPPSQQPPTQRGTQPQPQIYGNPYSAGLDNRNSGNTVPQQSAAPVQPLPQSQHSQTQNISQNRAVPSQTAGDLPYQNNPYVQPVASAPVQMQPQTNRSAQTESVPQTQQTSVVRPHVPTYTPTTSAQTPPLPQYSPNAMPATPNADTNTLQQAPAQSTDEGSQLQQPSDVPSLDFTRRTNRAPMPTVGTSVYNNRVAAAPQPLPPVSPQGNVNQVNTYPTTGLPPTERR